MVLGLSCSLSPNSMTRSVDMNGNSKYHHASEDEEDDSESEIIYVRPLSNYRRTSSRKSLSSSSSTSTLNNKKDENAKRPILPKLRATVSFNNPVALADYQDVIQQHAKHAREMIWRTKGEAAVELNNITDVFEHAIRGAVRAGIVGYCMRGSLNTVLALLKLRKTPRRMRLSALFNALLGADAFNGAIVLGSFVFTYKYLLNALPIIFPTSNKPRESIFVMPASPAESSSSSGVHVPSSTHSKGHARRRSALVVPPLHINIPPKRSLSSKRDISPSIPVGALSFKAQAHEEWIRKKTHRWHAVVAGAVAGGLAISFEKPHRRIGITQQMLVRGLQGFWNAYSDLWGISIPHGDSLVFCLSCAFIMYSHFLAPERLEPTYTHWISKLSNITPESLLMNRQQLRRGEFNVSLLEKVMQRNDVTLQNQQKLMLLHDQVTRTVPLWGGSYSPCASVHPMNNTCSEIPAIRMAQVAKRMLPVYAALTFIPLLLFRRRLVFKNPSASLFKASRDTLRSTAFISAFVTYYQTFFCAKVNLYEYFADKTWFPKPLHSLLVSKQSLWIGGIISGLSIFIEKPQRRAELAMYVLPKGLETIWATAQGHGLVAKRNTVGDVLLTAFAMGMFMGTYQNDPQHLSALVRKIAYQLVGPN